VGEADHWFTFYIPQLITVYSVI